MTLSVIKLIFLIVVPLIFSGVAFVLGIVALRSSSWIVVLTENIGLIETCSRATLLCHGTPSEPWLRAVFAFIALMVIFLSFGIVITILTIFVLTDALGKVPAFLFITAGVCGFIAMITFFATLLQITTPSSYGTGAVFGGISTVSSFLAAIFAHLAATGDKKE